MLQPCCRRVVRVEQLDSSAARLPARVVASPQPPPSPTISSLSGLLAGDVAAWVAYSLGAPGPPVPASRNYCLLLTWPQLSPSQLDSAWRVWSFDWPPSVVVWGVVPSQHPLHPLGPIPVGLPLTAVA